MKKVLFLISNLAGGGAEKVLTTYIKFLKDDYDITVQTLFNEGAYRDEICAQVKYETVLKNPTLLKKRILQRVIKYMPSAILHKFLIKHHYDCEIAFLEGLPSKVIAGAPDKINNFAWIHVDLRSYSLKVRGFFSKNSERKCYSFFKRIVCVSNDTKAAFCSLVNPKKAPLVIYNPIDNGEIMLLSKKTPEAAIEKKKFTIISVGRLVRQKGFDRFIYIMEKLQENGYAVDLWILGQGEEENNLKELIKQHKLESSIHMLGFHKNPYPIIAQADLFVCASRFEGYSLVVAEALTLGIPVVSTICAGPVELLGQGAYGLLVDNSRLSLYEGICKILNDHKLHEDLKEKAKIRGAQLSVDASIHDIKELIEEN